VTNLWRLGGVAGVTAATGGAIRGMDAMTSRNISSVLQRFWRAGGFDISTQRLRIAALRRARKPSRAVAVAAASSSASGGRGSAQAVVYQAKINAPRSAARPGMGVGIGKASSRGIGSPSSGRR